MAGALCAGGCTGSSPELDPIAEQLVCLDADVPDGYLLQVTGTFTGDDIEELVADEGARAPDGLEGGTFSYWREIVSQPPFDPPIAILCEALQFDTAELASAFVRGLQPGVEMTLPSLVWLPDEGRQFTEVQGGEGSPPGRFFRVSAQEDGAEVHLFAAYVTNGRFVQAVFVGDKEGRAGLDDLAALVERVHARGAELRP
ncbi:MAG: hypothetical protein IT303_00650 [Dehalococcoidia bacterium]|nr:hypothetical protein [Dehalococcoidia bacterium]